MGKVLLVAWKETGMQGRLTSTMVRHAIVTQCRQLENNCTEEEIRALAHGMDHSVKIAEKRYLHDKEKRQVYHSSIIRNFLNLNDWEEEIGKEIEKKNWNQLQMKLRQQRQQLER